MITGYREGFSARIASFAATPEDRWPEFKRGFHWPKCFWCGEQTVSPLQWKNPRRATREHLIPRILGGPDISENIVVACSDCNSRRGHSMEWKSWRRQAGS